WPDVLPGARAVLYNSGSAGNWDEAAIEVQSFGPGKKEPKKLVQGGSYPRFIPDPHGPAGGGFLLYMHQGTLFASAMSAKTLELTGPPVPVVQGVLTHNTNGSAEFSLARNGHLFFVADHSD